MTERLSKPLPCSGCSFHNFSQVHQCEPKGETRSWLLAMFNKAEKWDKLEGFLTDVGMNALLQAVEELEKKDEPV